MNPRAAVAAVAGLALAGAAFAQSPTAVEQLDRGSGVPLEASQVGAQTRPGEPLPQVSAHEDAPAAAQVSRPAEGRGPPAQLSARGAGAGPPDQLAKGARSAEGPAALSSPAQGRDPRVDRLQGDDRCDPQNLPRLAQAERARCAQVIERRSAEFDRPSPREPSPEERLLRGQQVAGSTDARTAARSLAEGEVDDSLAAQAVAWSANRPAADERRAGPREPDAELSPAAQSVIEAIVRGAAPGVTAR